MLGGPPLLARQVTYSCPGRTAELYVSDREGSDATGDGSKEKPFKTGLKVGALGADRACASPWACLLLLGWSASLGREFPGKGMNADR